MATVTLERLVAGIKAANAKGDIEAVKKLGLAYRKMQVQATGPAVAPEGLKPGSREYADWAVQQAKAGRDLPQVSQTPQAPQFTGPNQDIGSKLYTAGGSFLEGVPIAGPTLIDLAKQGRSALYGTTKEQEDQQYADAKEANPITSTASGIGGSIAALAPLGATALGGRLLGTVGSLPSRIGFGMGSGAVVSGADTLARGGSMEDAGVASLIGAGLGGVLPAIGGVKNALGNKATQRAATTAAIKNAPAAADLKSAASQMFQAVDNSGVTVDPNVFQQFVVGLAQNAQKMRINPKLDPKAYAAYEELGAAMGEALAGKPLTLGGLHNLRQIAQRAAVSSEGRDAMFANQIVDALDGFVTKPGSMMTPNGAAMGNELLGAISTWGRARRVGLVEDAIAKAQNTASGLENGLRIEFRKLLNNKKTAALFTAQEREEIERVVRGTTVANIAKLLGKFGFGTGGAGNMLGGTIGFGAGSVFGGPVGGVLAAGIGTGARKASEKLTEKAAERAAKVVATPNLPRLQPGALPQGVLPGALLPLEITKKRDPLQIMVRGGN